MTHFLLGNGFMAALWLWSVIASPSRPQIAKQEVNRIAEVYSRFPDWSEEKAQSFITVESILRSIER
ncbi:MAG: hypothetical protein AAFO04_29645 [Cyanobacteria bacterium J06592_8]